MTVDSTEMQRRGHVGEPRVSPRSTRSIWTSRRRLEPGTRRVYGCCRWAAVTLRPVVSVARGRRLLAEQVLALLRTLRAVANVVHLPGAAIEPAGDLVSVHVAREDSVTTIPAAANIGVAAAYRRVARCVASARDQPLDDRARRVATLTVERWRFHFRRMQ